MQPLQPFWGVLMLLPDGMELSLNACTHGCRYCFATLQDPQRRPSVPSIMNLLATYQERETYTATLLREGYPVCVSNRVDPFAGSNWHTMLPILETMAGLGIGVIFQTKGGKGMEQVLGFMPPSVWYITITTLSEEVRRRVEPQAPSIPSRLRLIEQLVAAGHSVYVGLNPLVPEWEPIPELLVDAVAAAGAFGIWADNLHLSADLRRGLKPGDREAMGDDVVARAGKRFAQVDEWELTGRACAHAESIGIAACRPGWAGKSDIWGPSKRLYRRHLPTWQDLTNCAWNELQDGDLVTFSWMWERLGQQFPQGALDINHYLGASSRQMFRTHDIPTRMTFRDLMKIAWVDERAKFCPTRHGSFSRAIVVEDGQRYWPTAESDGMPLLVWNRQENPDGDRVLTDAELEWAVARAKERRRAAA